MVFLVTRRWLGWGVVSLYYLVDVFARLQVNVFTADLQRDFNVDALTVSESFGSSFFYAYAAMQLPIGYLLDTLGPRRTLALCCSLTAVGQICFSFAQTPGAGSLARGLTGVGCGAGWISTIKVTRMSFGTDGTLAGRWDDVRRVCVVWWGRGGRLLYMRLTDHRARRHRRDAWCLRRARWRRRVGLTEPDGGAGVWRFGSRPRCLPC